MSTQSCTRNLAPNISKAALALSSLGIAFALVSIPQPSYAIGFSLKLPGNIEININSGSPSEGVTSELPEASPAEAADIETTADLEDPPVAEGTEDPEPDDTGVIDEPVDSSESEDF